ncbi:hypothetical protein LBMAG42_44440 [Deltaproteobacteria bacterium]|nr:hypothetical protein LBMAG42_44440 [Deltaproteobacteria bacterium]
MWTLSLMLACNAVGGPSVDSAAAPDTGDSGEPASQTCEPLRLELVASWDGMEIPSVSPSDSAWPGVAIGDVTGDGLPDLVGAFPGGAVLFRNVADGAWNAELLAVEGIDSPSSRSVALADLDDDGDLDAFLGADLGSPSYLMYNDGTGDFAASPLEDFPHRAWSAAFGDLDGDADLDLFAATYDADLDLDAILAGSHGGGQSILLQDAEGRFVPSPNAAPPNTDNALSLQGALLDTEGDGDLDIYLANDFGPYLVPNQMLVNDGAARFSTAGTSGSELAVYAMGAGVGDANGDGSPDLFVTDVGPPHLLLNDGAGRYADATQAMNAYIPATSANLVSWGAAFVDLDLDSWDDIVVSYGGLGSGIDVTALENADPTWSDDLDQASLWLHNQGGASFERDDAAFTDLARARGVAVGDLDLDGRPELVMYGKLYVHIFHASGGCGPGVAVTLRGPPGNANGFGARIDAIVEGRTTTRWMLPSVTAGQSALEVYVGLGLSEEADLTVTWADGAVTQVGEVEAGSRISVGRND